MGDSLTFTVNIIQLKTNLKITAIRLQDGATGINYSADGANGSSLTWDKPPKCTVGANLYIAAYAQSATAGRGMLKITCSADPATFFKQTVDMGANGSMGVESNWTMPASDVSVTIEATDV